jgi:hypothetical protein
LNEEIWNSFCVSVEIFVLLLLIMSVILIEFVLILRGFFFIIFCKYSTRLVDFPEEKHQTKQKLNDSKTLQNYVHINLLGLFCFRLCFAVFLLIFNFLFVLQITIYIYIYKRVFKI